MQGDPVPGIEHVADMTATQLIASASAWSAPHPLAIGAVVNPFAEEVGRECGSCGARSPLEQRSCSRR